MAPCSGTGVGAGAGAGVPAPEVERAEFALRAPARGGSVLDTAEATTAEAATATATKGPKTGTETRNTISNDETYRE